DPTSVRLLVVGRENAVNLYLRMTVHQRRVVGQRASIPVQRAVDVRSGAEIVEPTHAAVDEQQVQAIRMAMAAAGVAIVERDVRLGALAPEDRNALRVEKVGLRRTCLERRQLGARAQQRAPA